MMQAYQLKCPVRRLWICLVSLAALPAIASADMRIDAATLDQLPAGSVRHPSVQALAADAGGGISFIEGGLTVPTDGHLTAATGTVEVRFRVPEPWRGRRGQSDTPQRTLLHLAGDAGSSIALSGRGGSLTAIYKTGEKTAMIQYRGGRRWEADSSHTVELAWYPYGAGIVVVLRVDGQLAGVAEGVAMERVPAQAHIGVQADKHPFGGVIESVALKAQAAPEPTLQPGSRTIRVQAGEPAGKIYNFWDIQNTPLCYRAVDPAWIPTRAGKAPFSNEINCVYLLGGRWPGENLWFKGVKPDGTIETDFTGMIAQLKALITAGYVPHIVLDNVPNAMSDPPEENFYGNTAPPGDERVWHAYVQQAVSAMVDAFGRETVGGWVFRVGTEPDLKPAHWAGTREEYFAHYDYTVDAVASVVPEAKIGPGNILNPSRSMSQSDGPWGLDIIDHAATGTNAVTGEVGTRMDFFSCSWYGRVGGSVADFDAAVEAMRRRLRQYPQFADLPIHIGEHSVLSDEYGRRLWAGDTTEWGASFYAALGDRVYAQNVERVYEWDHATSGVMHPKGHVIWMLRQMVGGSRLAVAVDGTSAARCGAVAASKDGRILVLVYNHRQLRGPRVDETVRLEIHDPRMTAGSTWRVSEWTIDAERASWAYAYEADLLAAGLEPVEGAGRYEGALDRYFGEDGAKVFRANIAKYRKLAELPQTRDGEAVTAEDGRAVLEFTMPGHSVRLLELTAVAAAVAAPPVVRIETSMGSITAELRPDVAPKTVANFLAYVDAGFYDGTIFHRVIDGFMIQGGGFTAEMSQKSPGKPITNEASADLPNRIGTLAMARTGDPHSATCQFFINLVDNKMLNFREATARGFGYCVFGEVTEGSEVVGAIGKVATGQHGRFGDVPVEPVIIKSIRRVP